MKLLILDYIPLSVICNRFFLVKITFIKITFFLVKVTYCATKIELKSKHNKYKYLKYKKLFYFVLLNICILYCLPVHTNVG